MCMSPDREDLQLGLISAKGTDRTWSNSRRHSRTSSEGQSYPPHTISPRRCRRWPGSDTSPIGSPPCLLSLEATLRCLLQRRKSFPMSRPAWSGVAGGQRREAIGVRRRAIALARRCAGPAAAGTPRRHRRRGTRASSRCSTSSGAPSARNAPQGRGIAVAAQIEQRIVAPSTILQRAPVLQPHMRDANARAGMRLIAAGFPFGDIARFVGDQRRAGVGVG